MVPGSVRFFIFIHICISLGGMLVHMELHPAGKSLYFLWASPVSAFSLFVLPFLYCRPSTVGWGFMLNAGTVLIGTIGMSYYSLLNLERPLTLYKALFESALPGIVILWTKLPVSYFILKKMKPQKLPQRVRGCIELQEKT
jgi:hypothetical protein